MKKLLGLLLTGIGVYFVFTGGTLLGVVSIVIALFLLFNGTSGSGKRATGSSAGIFGAGDSGGCDGGGGDGGC